MCLSVYLSVCLPVMGSRGVLTEQPLKVIGNGCFGKVMMVKFKKTDKIYAMKSIRKVEILNPKPFTSI